jgi:hypothetical protein
MEKTKKIIILIVLIMSIIILLGVLYIFFKQPPVKYKELDVRFNIGNYTGFDVNNSGLYFGTLMPSQTGTRFILLQNDDDIPARFTIIYEGNNTEWVIFGRSIVVNPYDNYTLNFSLKVPSDALIGNYSGKVKIYQISE